MLEVWQRHGRLVELHADGRDTLGQVLDDHVRRDVDVAGARHVLERTQSLLSRDATKLASDRIVVRVHDPGTGEHNLAHAEARCGPDGGTYVVWVLRVTEED